MEKGAKIVVAVLIVTVVGIVLYVTLRDNTGPSGPVTIGFMGPLTGSAASYGQSAKRGVELALEDAGLENVTVIFEDTKCEGSDATSAMTKLATLDRASAVVGELCSSATLAASSVAEQRKVVLISPASTSPKITEAGSYVFRTVPSDSLQGDFVARLIQRKGFKKLAILYSNEDYGIGFEGVLRRVFFELGGEVVASASMERDAVDMRTQVAKIKAARPDAVFVVSNSPPSAVAALKQMRESGITVTVFGSEGLHAPEIIQNGGVAADGLIVAAVSSGTSGFTEKHRFKYREDPGPYAAQAYDAFTAIARAIKGGANTGEEIRDAFSLTSFDGASGHIQFDANGDVAGNYDVFVVKNGIFEPVTN